MADKPKEIKSDLMAEAEMRHRHADSDLATPQEKKQAALEKEDADATRPQGSHAQLHETDEPTVAVADDDRVKELEKQDQQAREALTGEPATGGTASGGGSSAGSDRRTRDSRQ
jgi:hypothetical protein